MNTDNKTTRELAIGWFNSKASLEKTRLCDTNTEIVGTVRRWETLTGREIELIYLSEHPTETETKKEKGKEGDKLAHENYPFGSTAEIGSRDRSLYEHKKESFIAGYNTLAKENKELKQNVDTLERMGKIHLASIQSLQTALDEERNKNKELKEDIIPALSHDVHRLAIENNDLKEQTKLLREALKDLIFNADPSTTSGRIDLEKSIKEAKQALNQ